MKISYDAEVDALSIIFRQTTVTTQHVAEGIAVDYDSEGHLAGIEILDLTKRFGGPDALRQVILQGIGPAIPG
ncbi:MAG: DUF2283 domain-containing protein [bacterium]|nr:DUF2283 domain-containing protein [bacterium]